MNPFSKGQPDWSGDIGDVTDMYNQLRAGMQPSQASMNQAAALQNQMTNQQYNQGLSGSTMGNQALGTGEMNAFQQDVDRQTAQALGMLPMVAQGNMQSQMMPYNMLGSILGTGAGMATSLLPFYMMMG